RGQRPVPRLLGEIGDGDIRLPAVVEERPPVILNNPENWEIARDAMTKVVTSIKGTARTAFKDATYTSAGKTGTAQVIGIAQDAEYDAESIAEEYRDNAMYVGYAPHDNPEIVIVLAVENAGGGGSVAAPLARKVMDFYFSQVNTLANNR
ncbi:penicillin-binding protein 2, partial [Pseudidiomarina aestuarii]